MIRVSRGFFKPGIKTFSKISSKSAKVKSVKSRSVKASGKKGKKFKIKKPKVPKAIHSPLLQRVLKSAFPKKYKGTKFKGKSSGSEIVIDERESSENKDIAIKKRAIIKIPTGLCRNLLKAINISTSARFGIHLDNAIVNQWKSDRLQSIKLLKDNLLPIKNTWIKHAFIRNTSFSLFYIYKNGIVNNIQSKNPDIIPLYSYINKNDIEGFVNGVNNILLKKYNLNKWSNMIIIFSMNNNIAYDNKIVDVINFDDKTISEFIDSKTEDFVLSKFDNHIYTDISNSIKQVVQNIIDNTSSIAGNKTQDKGSIESSLDDFIKTPNSLNFSNLIVEIMLWHRKSIFKSFNSVSIEFSNFIIEMDLKIINKKLEIKDSDILHQSIKFFGFNVSQKSIKKIESYIKEFYLFVDAASSLSLFENIIAGKYNYDSFKEWYKTLLNVFVSWFYSNDIKKQFISEFSNVKEIKDQFIKFIIDKANKDLGISGVDSINSLFKAMSISNEYNIKKIISIISKPYSLNDVQINKFSDSIIYTLIYLLTKNKLKRYIDNDTDLFKILDTSKRVSQSINIADSLNRVLSDLELSKFSLENLDSFDYMDQMFFFM